MLTSDLEFRAYLKIGITHAVGVDPGLTNIISIGDIADLLTRASICVIENRSYVVRHFLAAVLVGVSAILAIVTTHFVDSWATRVFADVMGLNLLGLTTLVMLNSLIQTDQVSTDTIVGGICVYLLVGLCFAMAFIALAQIDPSAFASDGAPIAAEDPSRRATKLLYFSFVTLTTLGYGDVTPTTDLAQMFAVAEALIGQLYLTIFVARLVALYVGRRRNEPTV